MMNRNEMGMVPRGGFEPPTRGFSVNRSMCHAIDLVVFFSIGAVYVQENVQVFEGDSALSGMRMGA
jgi:hypothetical protein